MATRSRLIIVLLAYYAALAEGLLQVVWRRRSLMSQSMVLPQRASIHSPPQFARRSTTHKTVYHTLLKESLTNNSSEDESDPNNNHRWTPLTLREKLQLPIQLVLSIYVLLLLPSGLAKGTLCGARYMSTIPYEYIFFFGLLVIPRSYRFGKFAKPIRQQPKPSAKKQQRSTSIQSLLLFIFSLIGTHWFATYQFAKRSNNLHQSLSLWAPNVCHVARLLACGLVGWSGWELGKSYDRVTQPEELITSGPYRIIRHPIYTAYLFLFGSTLLTLRAPLACACQQFVALYFYNGRMQSEELILEECFGDEFLAYKTKTPWRLLPFLL